MCEYLGNEALKVLDSHLTGKQYMVGEQYSAADISVFAYVHCSEEGGFDLDQVPTGEILVRQSTQSGATYSYRLQADVPTT